MFRISATHEVKASVHESSTATNANEKYYIVSKGNRTKELRERAPYGTATAKTHVNTS